MNQIQCNSQGATSLWNRQISKAPQTMEVANSKTTTVQASESRDVVLSITTKDGDTINLSLAASSQFAYQDYLESGVGKSLESTMFSAAAKQDFTMTVEGNLSEQEQTEIGKVLNTIDQMLADFVNGRLEPMMNKAQKLSQFDTIGSLSLEMSYSREVSVAQQTKVMAESDPQGITYDRQGQLIAAPRTGTISAVAPDQSKSTQAQNQVTAAADDLTTAMAQHLNELRDFAQTPFAAIRRIFDKYRQQVKNLNSDDAFGPALIDRMHKNLLDKLQRGAE
jgi:hypothetical protein